MHYDPSQATAADLRRHMDCWRRAAQQSPEAYRRTLDALPPAERARIETYVATKIRKTKP